MKILWLGFLLLCISVHLRGGAVSIPLQFVPQGIASVNGSNTDMGCQENINTLDGNMFCGQFSVENGGEISYLVDGISPDINPLFSDWASQLVTVNGNDPSQFIPVQHVLLTFDFYPAVSLEAIEIDLFLCPQWGIGAESITVRVENDTDLLLESDSVQLIDHAIPSMTVSCESLSTVQLLLQGEAATDLYHTWYVIVKLPTDASIEWVHIGEVRFHDTTISTTERGDTSTPSQPEFTTDSSPSPTPFESSSSACITCSTTEVFFKAPATATSGTASPSPSSKGKSEVPVALVVGIVGGALITAILITLLLVIIVVVRRQKRASAMVTSDNYYDYVKPPIIIPPQPELIDNDAYGQLDTSIPGALGVFAAPSVQSNIAYGVIASHESDGYEPTDIMLSQRYEEPQYISLTTV